MPDLAAAAKRAEEAAKQLGVSPRLGFSPRLDVSQAASRSGSISLHDGQVPLQMAGLGTKRVTSLAIQRESVRDGAIALIDEIEHGLEPFRVRQLIQEFKRMSYDPQTRDRDNVSSSSLGQAIVTTHSPIALVELDSSEVRITRSLNGVTNLLEVPEELQATLRASSEAFFASKIIVCEGKTELGLLRALEQRLAQPKYGAPLAWTATATVDGGGSSASARARDIASLGYETLLFVDADRDLQPDPTALRESDVHVVMWDEPVSTETRICRDVPIEALQAIVNLAATIKSPNDVRTSIAAHLPRDASLASLDIRSWCQAGFAIAEIRSALANAAMAGKRPWFKRIDTAEELGHVLADWWHLMEDTEFSKKIEELHKWCYVV